MGSAMSMDPVAMLTGMVLFALLVAMVVNVLTSLKRLLVARLSLLVSVLVLVAMFVDCCGSDLDAKDLMATSNLSGRVRSDADFAVIAVLTGCCC